MPNWLTTGLQTLGLEPLYRLLPSAKPSESTEESTASIDETLLQTTFESIQNTLEDFLESANNKLKSSEVPREILQYNKQVEIAHRFLDTLSEEVCGGATQQLLALKDCINALSGMDRSLFTQPESSWVFFESRPGENLLQTLSQKLEPIQVLEQYTKARANA